MTLVNLFLGFSFQWNELIENCIQFFVQYVDRFTIIFPYGGVGIIVIFTKLSTLPSLLSKTLLNVKFNSKSWSWHNLWQQRKHTENIVKNFFYFKLHLSICVILYEFISWLRSRFSIFIQNVIKINVLLIYTEQNDSFSIIFCF